MTAGWVLIWLAVIILFGGIRLAITIHDSRAVLKAIAEEQRLYGPYDRRLREEEVIRQALCDEAEYIVSDAMPNVAMRAGMAWPQDLCAYPPCDDENQWICTWHDPRGERLRYAPEPVVATITELPEPDDEWWTK